jgi:hypothetical protein
MPITFLDEEEDIVTATKPPRVKGRITFLDEEEPLEEEVVKPEPEVLTTSSGRKITFLDEEPEAETPAPVGTSFIEELAAIPQAIKQSIDQPLEAMGETAEVLGASGIGGALRGAIEGPEDYVPAAQRFMEPQEGEFQVAGFAPQFLPRAIVEQAGQIGGAILTRVGGMAIGGLAGSALGPKGTAAGAVAGAFIGPALFEMGQIVGPVARERAANQGREEPTTDDLAWAWSTAGASGALNAIGAKYIPGGDKLIGGLVKKISTAIAGEGSTEGLQSVVQQTGQTFLTEQGFEIKPKEVVGETLIGGGAGGAAVAATAPFTKAAAAAETKVVAEQVAPIAPETAQAVSEQANRVMQEAQVEETTETPEQRVARLQREAQEGVDIDLEEEVPVSGLPPERIMSTLESYDQIQAKQRDAREKFDQYAEEQRALGATEEQINEAREKQLNPALEKMDSDWRSATEAAATEWADSVDPFDLPALPDKFGLGEAKIFGEKLLQRLARDLGVTEDNSVKINVTAPNGLKGTLNISIDSDGNVRGVAGYEGGGAGKIEGFGLINFVSTGFSLATNESVRSRNEPVRLERPSKIQAPAAVTPTPVTPTPVTPEVPTAVVLSRLKEGGVSEMKYGNSTIAVQTPYQEGNIKEVSISSLRTPQRKRGLGSARSAMVEFLNETDAAGLSVGLLASPLDKTTKPSRLVNFYETLGFEKTGRSNAAGDPYMIRRPKPAPTVAPTPTAVEPPTLAPLRRVVKAEQTEDDVSGLVSQGLVELYKGQPVLTQAGLEALPEAERPRLTPEARKIQIDTRTSEAAAEAISKNLRIGVDQVPFDVRMPAGWTIEGDIYIPPQPQVVSSELDTAALPPEKTPPITPTPKGQSWDMTPPSSTLPKGLRDGDAIVKKLPDLTTREAMWIDLALHEVSNERAKTSKTRREWVKELQENSRRKLPLLQSLQSGERMTEEQARDVLAVIRESKEVHNDYLSGKYQGGAARGDKKWHRTWLNKYNEIEAEILRDYTTVEAAPEARESRRETKSTFKITADDARELQYKIGTLLENADLQSDYGISREQAKQIYNSIPTEGGNWDVPAWANQAIKGELEDQSKVLSDMADDARSENRTGEALRMNKQAKRFKQLSESVSAVRESRRAITPQQDRDYLDAVERGDLDAASRVVEDAAKRAGYTISVFHGTSNLIKFTEFKIGDIGFHFGDIGAAEDRAQQRWGNEAIVKPFYLVDGNFAKVRDVGDFGDSAVVAEELLRTGYISQQEYNSVGSISGGGESRNIKQLKQLRQILVDKGYDGISYTNRYEGFKGSPQTSYAIFNSSLVKSAAPVTYDDAGNIIPPSQRFQQGEADIRYARGQAGVGMTTDAVRARLEALGFGVEGMIRIVEDPQAAFEGRTIIQDGKAVRIELNASALRDNAAIDRVLNHEFAEAANADGTLNKLVERLTPKEKKEINDAITRLGYEERVRTTEEAARAIEALAAGWKGQGIL